MGKAPAFQFYVKDWLSDPELQCVSASSRGIWIDALCYMWGSPERGKLSGTPEELSKLLRATNGDFIKFMDDVKRHKFADVTNCNNEVTLINRRMFREENERKNTRLRVSRFRSNAQCNVNVTLPSPSASPSPTPKQKKIYKRKVLIPDEEWILNLQGMECYSHLSVKEQFEKCTKYFEPKGVTRKRFLNWLNHPKNAKPMQIKKEQPKIEPDKSSVPGWMGDAIKEGWKT